MSDDIRRSVVGMPGPSHVHSGSGGQQYDSSEFINRIYDQAIDRNKSLQSELTQLRRISDDTIEEQKREIQRLRQMCDDKQDELEQVRQVMQSTRAHCTVAIQSYNTLNTKNTDLESQLQRELDKLKKSDQELNRVCKEKDEIARNYNLIMSERDNVHKEIETLQDRLTDASKQVNHDEKEKKALNETMKFYKQELDSAMNERDQARRDHRELKEIVKQMLPDDQPEPLTGSKMASGRSRLQMDTHQRSDSMGNDLSEERSKRNSRVSASFDKQEVTESIEVEMLRKEIGSLKKTLEEVQTESGVYKKRRDWAFSERDKIVQERESIRLQCDVLRRDRDRAVSEHAQVLRELDDLKQQASREMEQLREKLEKEERANQLIRQSDSRDSAIDNDLQDWETNTLDYNIEASGYHPYLGLDLTPLDEDEADTPTLVVAGITSGSPCDGRLHVNDVLLRINQLDVSHSTKEEALDALRSTGSTVSIRVRRRRQLHRLNFTIDLKLNQTRLKRDVGFQLEGGLYISRISPGSALAKEGCVAVGDRLLAVDEKPVDNKSPKEVMKQIESSGGRVSLHIGKYGSQISDSQYQAPYVRSQYSRPRSGEHKSGRKPHADEGTATTGKHKGGQIKNLINKLIRPRDRNQDDELDTMIKAQTDDVMKTLDEINNEAECSDSTGTWPRRSEVVAISHNGTVTARPRTNTRNAIPDTFIEPSLVYRPQSGDPYISLKSTHNVKPPVFKPPSYESKGQTLPGNSSSRNNPVIPESDSRSKSLGGFAKREKPSLSAAITNSSRSTINSPYNSSSSFYTNGSHTSIGSSSQSRNIKELDEGVHQLINKIGQGHRGRNGRPGTRPVSLQPNSLYAQRTTSPFDHRGDFPQPSSPHHHTKPQRLAESPVGAGPPRYSRMQSGSGPPRSQSGSVALNNFPGLSSSQLRSPHQPGHPPYSAPPPYTVESKIMPPSKNSHPREHVVMTPSFPQRHVPHYIPPNWSQTLPGKHKDVQVGGEGVFQAPRSTSGYSRMKFPSNQSVSSAKRSINSNSLELVSSGRSSPLSSPNNSEMDRSSEEVLNGRPSSRNRAKLKEGVLRVIELDTSFSQLGFNFEEEPGIGIIVASVTSGGLAHQVGIEPGDQIVEFMGINMLTATYKTAASVLIQWRSGDSKVIMKVQYNPRRRKLSPAEATEMDRSSVTSIQNSIQNIHTTMENSNNGNKKQENSNTGNKKQLYVVHSNGSSSDDSKPDPPRTVYFHRTSNDVGIRLRGGNQTGVFVAEILNTQASANGLKVGDQMLEVNGRTVQTATAETVAIELNRPTDPIKLVVQYNMLKYSMIATAGDHFYVRAHFAYDASNDGDLSIASGDLLLVENSLLHGQIGKWYATKIDARDDRCSEAGVIPSSIRLEEALSLRRSFSDVMPADEPEGKKGRMGSIGRRGFFRRKSGRNQHQRNGSRDSRELTSFSDLSMSSDNVPITDDGYPQLYQRVERIRCDVLRPVIVLGPFSDHLIRKLVSESPDKYVRYEEEFLNTTQTFIEKGITDRVFVDYKKAVNDLFKVTRTESLRQIASSNRHAMLIANPSAVEKMHKCQLYPIVIYIKHKSLRQVKEVKDPKFLPERLSSRSAKDLFEHFQKVEIEFKNIFTVEIQGSNMAAMSQDIKKAIDEEQTKYVWI